MILHNGLHGFHSTREIILLYETMTCIVLYHLCCPIANLKHYTQYYITLRCGDFTSHIREGSIICAHVQHMLCNICGKN